MDDLKYLNGQGPKPIHTIKEVPFLVSNQKEQRLYHHKDEGAEYPKRRGRRVELTRRERRGEIRSVSMCLTVF
jgi:hypothetical protein